MQWMNWVKWACDWKQFRHFYNELKYISTLNDYTKIDSNVNGRWGNRKLWGVYLTISVISIVHLTTLQHSHCCCCWIHCSSLAACCGRWWICSPDIKQASSWFKNSLKIIFSQVDMRALHQVSKEFGIANQWISCNEFCSICSRKVFEIIQTRLY